MSEPSRDDLADTISATFKTLREMQDNLQFYTDVILGMFLLTVSFAFCYHTLRKVMA